MGFCQADDSFPLTASWYHSSEIHFWKLLNMVIKQSVRASEILLKSLSSGTICMYRTVFVEFLRLNFFLHLYCENVLFTFHLQLFPSVFQPIVFLLLLTTAFLPEWVSHLFSTLHLLLGGDVCPWTCPLFWNKKLFTFLPASVCFILCSTM